ncbi:MAG TPA: HEPN domain-containing protein [Candidatus Limnocylindria bacterium]
MSTSEVRDLMERMRPELDAARALAERELLAQAIVHAYYATFFAVEAALLALGETRSKHSGVISGFGQHVVKSGGIDPAVGSVVRRLFELRNAATYGGAAVDTATAASAIADAERFVEAVEGWLARRSGP